MSDPKDFLKDVDAVVFDLDHTLHRGYIGTAIYKSAIKKPTGFAKFLYGSLVGVSKALWKETDRIQMAKQLLLALLSRTEIRRQRAYAIAERVIREKPVHSGRELLEAAVAQKKHVFLCSVGPDIAADIYSRMYPIKDYIANPVKYDENGIIRNFDILVRPSTMSLKIEEMLKRNGVKLERCMMVGNDWYYADIMKRCVFGVASPNAGPKVKRAATFRL